MAVIKTLMLEYILINIFMCKEHLTRVIPLLHIFKGMLPMSQATEALMTGDSIISH